MLTWRVRAWRGQTLALEDLSSRAALALQESATAASVDAASAASLTASEAARDEAEDADEAAAAAARPALSTYEGPALAPTLSTNASSASMLALDELIDAEKQQPLLDRAAGLVVVQASPRAPTPDALGEGPTVRMHVRVAADVLGLA